MIEMSPPPPEISKSGYHCYKNLVCGKIYKESVKAGASCGDSDSWSNSFGTIDYTQFGSEFGGSGVWGPPMGGPQMGGPQFGGGQFGGGQFGAPQVDESYNQDIPKSLCTMANYAQLSEAKSKYPELMLNEFPGGASEMCDAAELEDPSCECKDDYDFEDSGTVWIKILGLIIYINHHIDSI